MNQTRLIILGYFMVMNVKESLTPNTNMYVGDFHYCIVFLFN